MPINRLLIDSKLNPDVVKSLNRAFDLALRSLGLADCNDPLTELVAENLLPKS